MHPSLVRLSHEHVLGGGGGGHTHSAHQVLFFLLVDSCCVSVQRFCMNVHILLDTSACIIHAGNIPHSSNECQQGLDFTCIDRSHPMENGKVL